VQARACAGERTGLGDRADDFELPEIHCPIHL
jgi:hypothetical protein